jgi:hypothetical protein
MKFKIHYGGDICDDKPNLSNISILDQDWIKHNKFAFDHDNNHQNEYEHILVAGLSRSYIIPYFIEHYNGSFDKDTYNKIIGNNVFQVIIVCYMRSKNLLEIFEYIEKIVEGRKSFNPLRRNQLIDTTLMDFDKNIEDNNFDKMIYKINDLADISMLFINYIIEFVVKNNDIPTWLNVACFPIINELEKIAKLVPTLKDGRFESNVVFIMPNMIRLNWLVKNIL